MFAISVVIPESPSFIRLMFRTREFETCGETPLKPRLSRADRDSYWKRLTRRFRHVPAQWSITDGRRPKPKSYHGTSILSCRFLDDSTVAIAGGGRIPGCDSTMRVWENWKNASWKAGVETAAYPPLPSLRTVR